jgi:hypothetical protein
MNALTGTALLLTSPIACSGIHRAGTVRSVQGECIVRRRVTLASAHKRAHPLGFVVALLCCWHLSEVNGTWCGDDRGPHLALTTLTASAASRWRSQKTRKGLILTIESARSCPWGRSPTPCGGMPSRFCLRSFGAGLNSSGLNKRAGESMRTSGPLTCHANRRQSFWRSHCAGSKLSYGLVAPRTTCEWCPFAATLWLSVRWRLHAPIDHRQLASGENGQ